jgi:hypothetical protein
MDYKFALQLISQHIVKYGLQIQPPLSHKDDRQTLQDYANWLIEQFPQAFETLLSGPNQFAVQKSFLLANSKRADIGTFVLAARGPLFTFPQRLFVDQVQNIRIPDKDQVFRTALNHLQIRFADRKAMRLDVMHELVFDTGQMNSLEVITATLKNDLWSQLAKNVTIRLDTLIENKSVGIEIKPTYLMQASPALPNTPAHIMRYGIIVNVDIRHQPITGTQAELTNADIDDLLTFAAEYVPEELIKFLNNEQ